MAAIDNLNANIQQLSTDVAKLLALPNQDTAIQAAADAVAALDKSVQAALPAPTPAPAPTPTPAVSNPNQ